MGIDSDGPTDWDELFEWYVSATDLIEDLDGCWVLVDAMVCGSPTPYLEAALALNTLTTSAERWLALHPCPEEWNTEQMAAIVHGFMDIGSLLVRSGGDPAGSGQLAMTKELVNLGLMLNEVKELVARLALLRND